MLPDSFFSLILFLWLHFLIPCMECTGGDDYPPFACGPNVLGGKTEINKLTD
jgi:hypothetical protein